MPVDPTDPDTFSADDTDELAADAPEADAVEQSTDIRPEQDDPLIHLDPDTANEADALEQARVVTLDEDEYR